MRVEKKFLFLGIVIDGGEGLFALFFQNDGGKIEGGDGGETKKFSVQLALATNSFHRGIRVGKREDRLVYGVGRAVEERNGKGVLLCSAKGV